MLMWKRIRKTTLPNLRKIVWKKNKQTESHLQHQLKVVPYTQAEMQRQILPYKHQKSTVKYMHIQLGAKKKKNVALNACKSKNTP